MIEENRRVPNSKCRFELIDKDGNVCEGTWPSAAHAATAAMMRWPDQEQDEDRMGKGWDIQVCGADR